MKKVLLLGGNGFVGKHLKSFFSNMPKEYEITAPDRKELDLLSESQVDAFFDNHQFQIVLFAAIFVARTIEEEKEILDRDLRMFFHVMKHEDEFEKLLYFGSGAEYEKRWPICGVKEEEFEMVPDSSYGFAKYIINQSIHASKNAYNLRLFGVFGPYENWKSTFISGACCKALKGLPITIRKNVYFDYLWVEDLMKIVKNMVDLPLTHKEYNVVSGKKIDLVTIAKMVKEISRKEIAIIVCEEGLANEYTASNDRLLKEFPDVAYTDMRETIEQLYHWYEQREDEIDLLSLLY